MKDEDWGPSSRTSENLKHTRALVVTGSKATSSCHSDVLLNCQLCCSHVYTVRARAPSPTYHVWPPTHTHTLTV